MEELLEEVRGSLVKLVFHDGDRTAVKRGYVEDVSEDYVKFKTKSHVYFINHSDICKIQKDLKGVSE